MNRIPLSRKSFPPVFIVVLGAAACLLAAAPAAAQPTFSKVFSPDVIGSGSTSRLTFVIDNSEGSFADQLTFTDMLPAGVTLADPPSVTNTCAGTVTAPGGGSTLDLTGGDLAGGSTCSIGVDVTSSTLGTHTNTSGNLISSAGDSGQATDDLTVSAGRPGFSKSFSSSTIPLGATVTLTFTIDNTNDEVDKLNLFFTDPLPSGLVVAGPANVTGDCLGVITASPGSSSISLSSGFVAAGEVCTLSVDVTATGPGAQINRSGSLNSTGGDSGFAVDAVDVTVEPLTLVKSFVNDPVAPGGTATLRFTIHAFTRDPVTDLSFTDDLDATLTGLVATDLPKSDVCGAGSLVSGAGLVSFTGGSLAAGDSCTFDVTVQVPTSATPGVYPNSTSTVTGDVGGVPTVGSPAVDDLVVAAAPVLTKTISPDPAEAGDVLTVEFLLENNTADDMTGLAFSDDFESFLSGSSVVADPGSGYCNGTGTTGVGATTIAFSNIDLASGASCTFSFTLQVPLDTESGLYTNSTSEVTGFGVDMAPVTGQPASDDVTILAAPTLDKSFLDPVAPGDTVTLRFTLSAAEDTTETATDIAFTDDLSAVLAGLAAIDTPITDVCGAGSMISGSTLLAFTGGTLDPNSSCTFSVTLQVPAGAAPGSYPNTTSDVTAMTGGVAVESSPATDDLDVTGLSITKQFTDDPAVAGGTVTLELVLRNDDPSFAATGIAFTDDLSAALAGLAYNGPALMDVCGAGSQLTGTSTLSFTGGSLAPGASCTIPLVLDVPAGAAAGEYFNTTSQVTATVDGSPVVVAGGSDALTIVDPLTIEKEFLDDPVLAGGTVTLQFTLTNLHPTEPVTGVAFTDDLDAALSGLVATGTPVMACGGTLSGTSLLTFTGGTVAAASSCTVTVTLQVPAAVPSGTVATNTTSSVTGTIDGVGVTGDPASDDLRVEVADFTKSFDGPSTATGTAVLTFTIENLSGTDGLTGLSFTDDLNATLSGLVAVGLPMSDVCGAGSQISGTSFLTFSGGTLGAGETCSFDVTVQVPAGASPGTHTNTTSALTASGLEIGTPASADLEIEPPPAFAKSFSPAVTGVGVASTLTFEIDNGASALAATGLAFTDTLPAGVTVATPANASTTCTGGTITAAPGSGTVSYTGGTVAAGGTCTVEVDVVAGSTGSFMNVSGELTSSSGSSGTASSTLTVRPAPTVTKAFSPTEIALGDTTTVIVTIDNSANILPATGLSFTDTLPSGLVVADPSGATTDCTGGTLVAVPGASQFSYSGGTVAAGAVCAVMVDVTASLPGALENVLVVDSSLGQSAEASAVLQVEGSIVEIPTAGTWGLLALGLLLATGALWRLRF